MSFRVLISLSYKRLFIALNRSNKLAAKKAIFISQLISLL
ncbi:uncharacterized protein FFM5_07377 [Fusarium fujikuroi]|nr:uncharacterized protein FFM5_07377 [Fusarium fujikuroi]